MTEAALIDCPPIARTEGAKVVVGDVRPLMAAATGSPPSPLQERRLLNAIYHQISQLNVGRMAEVRAVICHGRWPEGPDVFTMPLSRTLLDQEVLIELWGVIEADVALIYYAVLPVRVRGESNLPGVYPSAYGLSGDSGISTIFREAPELKAFTALALGLHTLEQALAASTASNPDKVARSTRFNDARTYFCDAERLLRDAERASSEFGPDAHQWKALVTLATDLAVETAQLARHDPDYIGSLKLLSDNLVSTCQPGAT